MPPKAPPPPKGKPKEDPSPPPRKNPTGEEGTASPEFETPTGSAGNSGTSTPRTVPLTKYNDLVSKAKTVTTSTLVNLVPRFDWNCSIMDQLAC